MSPQKYLFIDRDGTLIVEPPDEQVDHLTKLALIPGVIPALLQLKQAGFQLIMISNQDGLGSAAFPQENFTAPQQMLLQILNSQGIEFSDILICPHLPHDQCGCRKPKLGLVQRYLVEQTINRTHSFVIGDRQTDLELAANMGIHGIRLGDTLYHTWQSISDFILTQPRQACIKRQTLETKVIVNLDLDADRKASIHTGIGFFDHMLEQIAKHGQFYLNVNVTGDLHIDAHHTVEDTALGLGQALNQALDNRRGINRYGFLLPMDEALAHIAIDLGGRPYAVFEGTLPAAKVGEFDTELVPHFFHSLADQLKAAIHIKVTGKNTHHMIEAAFKGFGRALGQAIQRNPTHNLPSTKGVM